MYALKQIYDALDINSVKLDIFMDPKDYSDHPFLKEVIKDLQHYANTNLDLASLNTTFSTYKLFEITGDRAQYQKPYYAKRKRLMTFALLLQLFPDNQDYLSELEEIIWLICNEYTWCLPAHGPEKNNHLDLFACETGFALAETLYLHEQILSEQLTTLVKKEIKRRLLIPFMDNTRVHKFEAMTNNWSAVCGGALGAIAIYLIDDQAELAHYLNRVFSSIQLYLDSFGDDGVCTEGVGYWTYGFGFFVCFSDLLLKKTHGKIDLFKDEKVKSIAHSLQYFYIFGNQVISYADGTPTSTYRLGLLTYLQKKYPTIKLPEMEYASSIYHDNCYRFCFGLRDIIWITDDVDTGLPSHYSIYLDDAQWFISKGTATALAAKGGCNDEPHNHNDVGSFIYFAGHQQVLCDLGAGLYDAKYFSKDRYTIFCNNSLSHNVPVVNGYPQSFGDYKASHVKHTLSDSKDTFSLNMTDCYPDPHLTSLTRELIHCKESGTTTLKDEYVFTKPSSIIENFITMEEPVIKDQSVHISIPDGLVVITPTLNANSIDICPTSFVNHHGQEVTCYVISFYYTTSTSSLSLTFDISHL